MKIRNGFVSNSSSSSFVLRVGEEFSSVSDVAQYIMESIENEWGNDPQQVSRRFEIVMNNLKQLSDPNTPVHFNTGGDETYIRKFPEKNGDVILITTTQNASFDKIENLSLEDNDISEELYKYFHHEDEYPEDSYTPDSIADLTYYYHKFNDFLVLEYGFLGRHEYFDDDDKKIEHKNNCFYRNRNFLKGWILNNGQKICDCQINKIVRKIKLEKIDQNEN